MTLAELRELAENHEACTTPELIAQLVAVVEAADRMRAGAHDSRNCQLHICPSYDAARAQLEKLLEKA